MKHVERTYYQSYGPKRAGRLATGIARVSIALAVNACGGRADSVPEDDSAPLDVSPQEAPVDASLPAAEPSDVVPNASLCRLAIGETTFAETRALLGTPDRSLPGTRLVYGWGANEARYGEHGKYLDLELIFDPDERLEFVTGGGRGLSDCVKAWAARQWNLLQHRQTLSSTTATAPSQNPLDYPPLPASAVLCKLTPGETTYVPNGSDFGDDGARPLFTVSKFETDTAVRQYRFGDLETGEIRSIYLYFRHDTLEDIVTFNLRPQPPCWE